LLDFTTDNILVETYESGTLLRDYLDVADTRQKKRVGKAGLNGIFKMVFFDNFIHADLHGGNIIVNKNSATDFRLCFIDCGITGELNQSDQRNLIDLFKAVIENNGYEVGLLMAERSRFPTKIPKDGKEKFAREMGMIINHIHSVGLRPDKININELLSTVLMLCFKYQVKLESRYATILIAMGIVEGLGRELDPNINIMANATPFVMKASIEQMLAKSP
jgi:aarF domain-containing kinase